MKKYLLRTTIISVSGTIGFLIGQQSEKRNNEQIQNRLVSVIENLPGLPLFGTVSAAVPVPNENDIYDFSEANTKLKRVSEVTILYSNISTT